MTPGQDATTHALVCPMDHHTLGCRCDRMTCVHGERGAAALRAPGETR